MTAELNKHYVYLFELVHPDTELVVKYGRPQVYVLSQRNMDNYEELPYFYPVKGTYIPKLYSLDKIEDVLKVVEQMNEDHEGVVVCDSHFNRIKIKSPTYLMRARAMRPRKKSK